MLLMMLERGEHIDEIVTVDTGMEFPEMYEHLEKLQKQVNIPFTTLKSENRLNITWLTTKSIAANKQGSTAMVGRECAQGGVPRILKPVC